MPFLVRDLIGEHRAPVTVRPEDSLQVALARMTEHDFSQLPVVDADGCGHDMVTSDSILRAIKALGVTPASLRVRDVKVKAPIFRQDDDLFELLDDLRDTYAVLVCDDAQRVVGMVTAFDATEYFRRRTEDMMFVEDIEIMLKDHIQAAHADPSGEPDLNALRQSIRQCAKGVPTQRKNFFAALQRYLERCQREMAGQEPRLDPGLAADVFAQTFMSEAPRSLDDLTFADYEALLLSKEQWSRYAAVFEPLNADALRHMLDGVRETRNALAHFRADVTPEQQERLKFCVEWLKTHPAARPQTFSGQSGIGLTETAPPAEDSHLDVTSPSASPDVGEPPDEAVEPRDSRYAPLAIFLMRQPTDRERVTLSFHAVEEILNSPLPPYARQHRAFWSNDTTSHPQSRQWLDVDWRVSSVDMSDELVVFSRIKERERLYIHFFSTLLADLRSKGEFPIRKVSPAGHSWIIVAKIPEQGPQVAALGFSFARNHRFRIEIYIDTEDRDRNKRIFDYLYTRRREVQEEILPESVDASPPSGVGMTWERLDARRACRISLQCPASITDDEAQRKRTIAWAQSATPGFAGVMVRLVTEAVREGA